MIIKIQEATKQAVNHIAQCDRKHMPESSRKIADDELAKMKLIIKKAQAKNVTRGT